MNCVTGLKSAASSNHCFLEGGEDMRREFFKQGNLCVVIVLVSNVLNTLFRHWIYSSIGLCLCGLIWFFHPAKMNDIRPEASQLLECRIAGMLLFLMGLMLRAKFY